MKVASQPLRVGIIGLGPNWRNRYRRALLAERDRFAIRMVCDEVHARAARQARRLGCEAADGPSDLIHYPELDAILLLDQQWFGLWPLELACEAKKPVFSVLGLDADFAHADRVWSRIRETRLPVLFEMRLRVAPAMILLRRLLETQLGPLLNVVCQVRGPLTPTVQEGGRTVGVSDVVACCLQLLDDLPLRVQAAKTDAAGGLESLLIEFPGPCVAQIISIRSRTEMRSRVTIEVTAEQGHARAVFPDQLGWTYRHTEYRRSIRGVRRPEMRILREVAKLARSGSHEQGIDAAVSLRILQAAARSQAEGRWIDVERT